MSKIILAAHSGIRWLVVLILVIVLVKYLMGWLGNQKYGDSDKKLWSALNGILGIQFLLGLIFLIMNFQGIFMEHATIMLLAVLLPGIASSRMKTLPDQTRFRNLSFVLMGVSLLIFVGVWRVGGW